MAFVQYTSNKLLGCAECNRDVIICLRPPFVIIPGDGQEPDIIISYAEATFLNYFEVRDKCGRLQYVHNFEYEDLPYLPPPHEYITPCSIKSVICTDCLYLYFKYKLQTAYLYIYDLLDLL